MPVKEALEVNRDFFGTRDRDYKGVRASAPVVVGPLDVLREPEQIGRLDGIHRELRGLREPVRSSHAKNDQQ